MYLFILSQIPESVIAVPVTDAISSLFANVRNSNMLLKLTFGILYNQIWKYIHIFVSVGGNFDLMVVLDN